MATELETVLKSELAQATGAHRANRAPTLEELDAAVETSRAAAQRAVADYFDAIRARYRASPQGEKLAAWRAYNRACIVGRYPQAYRGKPIDDDFPHPEYEGEPHPSTIDFIQAVLRG